MWTTASWQARLEELLAGSHTGSAGVEPRRHARAFVLGLLADLPRKHCWTGPSTSGHPGTSAAGMLPTDTTKRETTLHGCERHHGAAVRLLDYRLLMRSQLSPSRLGFQATGTQPPRRSKARAPTPGRGPAVPTATQPDPMPGRISGTPRPGGGLRPGRPAVSTVPRRRVGENRRRVR